MNAADDPVMHFKLTIEYDGTDFHGWQIQPNVRTVQGELESTLGGLLGSRVHVDGCCRTDAGVHATGFVAGFQAATRLTPDRLAGALAANLPEDVVVRAVETVAADFHARHSCTARRYEYRVTARRPALQRRYLAFTKYRLDADRMAEGARHLVGRHDFTSFAPSSLANDVSPTCTVAEAVITSDGPVVRLEVEADRFLHHMVRNIAGTLMEVGRGRYDPEHVAMILRKKDRRAAGPTAPACGLVLVKAYYGGRDCP